MNFSRKRYLAVWMTVLLSGCASVNSIPSRMKAFVWQQPEGEDPLLADASVSDEFEVAKKQLKHADKTMLAFAQMCESRGDFAEAKRRYQDVLADNPNNIEARVGIARVEFQAGRKAEAESILMAASEKHPESARVWMEMGRVQSAREQWAAAAESLGKASTLEPNNQHARYELGLALARCNRVEEAVPHLKFAVGESAAMYNIAFVLKESGRNDEARTWTQRALQSYPDQRTRTMAEQMMASLNRSAGTAQNPRHQVAQSQPSRGRTSQDQIAQSQPASRVVPGSTTVEAFRETPKDWSRPPAGQPAGTATVRAGTGSGSAMTPATRTVADSRQRDIAVRQTSYATPPAMPENRKTAQAAAPRIIRQPTETTTSHRGQLPSSTAGIARLPAWNGPSQSTAGRTTIGNSQTVDPPNWQ